MELQKRFRLVRAQAGHGPPELHDAAGVASIAQHEVEARGSQARMLLQHLPHETQVGVSQRRAKRGTVEAIGFNGVAHRVAMNTEFAGNRADFPMLGIEVAPYKRAGFWANHPTGLTFVAEWVDRG